MWVQIVLFVVSLLIQWLTRKEPENTLSPGDFSSDTAESGSTIGWLFGTRDISGTSTCVWYGDIKTTAVKKKSGKK